MVPEVGRRLLISLTHIQLRESRWASLTIAATVYRNAFSVTVTAARGETDERERDDVYVYSVQGELQ